MRIVYFVSGLVTLAIGVFLWVAFAAASAFSTGFGGDDISVAWFLIPAAVTFGGPTLFWVALPIRRRRRIGRRE